MAGPVQPSPLRALVVLIVGIETVLAVAAVAYCLAAGVSPEARSLNRDIAVLVSGVFAFTTAPAAGLLLWGRGLWLAACLAALPLAAFGYSFAS